MTNTYKTNRELTLEFMGRTLNVPKGAEIIYVPEATYCSKAKKRVAAYALKNPEDFGGCPHDSKHRYCFVPDNAVQGRKADAILVRKALKSQSDDWRETADRWIVNINGQVFDYYTGIGHRNNKAAPQLPLLDDVLFSLVSDSDACEMSFNEWCSNFGYDTDSRKALAVYELCQENTDKLRKAGVDISAERERLADY